MTGYKAIHFNNIPEICEIVVRFELPVVLACDIMWRLPALVLPEREFGGTTFLESGIWNRVFIIENDIEQIFVTFHNSKTID